MERTAGFQSVSGVGSRLKEKGRCHFSIGNRIGSAAAIAAELVGKGAVDTCMQMVVVAVVALPSSRGPLFPTRRPSRRRRRNIPVDDCADHFLWFAIVQFRRAGGSSHTLSVQCSKYNKVE